MVHLRLMCKMRDLLLWENGSQIPDCLQSHGKTQPGLSAGAAWGWRCPGAGVWRARAIQAKGEGAGVEGVIE